jgi:hypothetical protein
MKTTPDSISKNPSLSPAADFYGLRRTAIGLIEQMASDQWTDYNGHDPGITILESLCYAITDLSYRSQWPIADLLTLPDSNPQQPYPDQAFFTARSILTVNPVSEDDWRRLLIDLDQVRNAWIDGHPCACDFGYFAWCSAQQQLQLSYQTTESNAEVVKVQGLYDVLVELENDPELGDLNARSIQADYSLFDAQGLAHGIHLELRYPQLGNLSGIEQALLIAAGAGNPALQSIDLLRIADNRTYNVLTDPSKTDVDRDNYLRSRWNQVLYLDITLGFVGGQTVTLNQTTLRIYSDNYAKQNCTLAAIKQQLQKSSRDGLVPRLLRKLSNGQQTLDEVKQTLHRHRNLDEDFRRVKVVEIEEIAVCADFEVRADADIELIQAQIWLILEQFCSPQLSFSDLQSLRDRNIAVETIFNGPALNNGFVDSAQLQAAQLPSVLRSSDLLNLLMAIDGLVSVNNLLLSKYDRDGQAVQAASDSCIDGSCSNWQVNILPLHQPRFHRDLSRLLFYKNGLPFLARSDEALATLQALRGQQLRPKIRTQADDSEDIMPPLGHSRAVGDYWPMQYALPPVYGIGPEGLPTHAGTLRHAQAKQLKGYLLVFEQILANAQAQIDHCRALFSLNPAVSRSYFVHLLSEHELVGYAELVDGLSQDALEALTETASEFIQRRNRFLDHLLARFGESFSEYALLVSRPDCWLSGEQRLIEDKLGFLQDYPKISHDRYRAFDLCSPFQENNIAGLEQRVALLLGFPNLQFAWEIGSATPFSVAYRLNDGYRDWFSGQFPQALNVASRSDAHQQAYQLLLQTLGQSSHYQFIANAAGIVVRLINDNGQTLGQSTQTFASETLAQAFQDELISWSSQSRAIVVEHILLRPKFPGDALYPTCSEPCSPCDADPYSFRLTWVMPGWTAPFNTDLDLRAFADRTIRRETPAHLLPKICWLANDGFDSDPALINNLGLWFASDSVKNNDGTQLNNVEAAASADKLYRHLLAHFSTWYLQHRYQHYADDLLKTALAELLKSLPTEVDLGAAVLTDANWEAVGKDFVGYFYKLVRGGWQFERFQQAWQQWLQANRQFDWQALSISEEVQILLKNRLEGGATSQLSDYCQKLLNAYGQHFNDWLQGKLENRVIPQPWNDSDFSDFSPLLLDLGAYGSALSFSAGTRELLQDLLDQRYRGFPGQPAHPGYQGFREVSYALLQLLRVLADINSTYPSATLHDCDDGSDQNPVRLNTTLLGSLASDSDSSLTL